MHKQSHSEWSREILRSSKIYMVRIVHTGGDRKQTSKAFNASKSSLTESYYMTWLLVHCLLPETLFYDSFEKVLA